MELKDRVAIVTGGGTGIGRAVCLRLARAGAAAVVVNYSRSEDEAKTAARDIEVLGAKAVTHRADVASESQVISMIEETMSRFGRLDVLVNNAGTTHFIPHANLDALTDDVWNEILSVNLKGGFLCAQAVARALVAAGRPGAIVNIASSAVRGDPRGVHYSASKAGVVGMTRAMALALAPHRIRVNAIAPGLTDTQQPRDGNTEAQIAERAREIPLGRMAQPEEIARVAVFLATSDAAWITGELIHVNGGAYMA